MSRFKACLVAIAVMVMTSGPAFAHDEMSLKAADQEQRRLVFESDTAGLMALVHPEMLINGPQGRIVTREQFMESVGSGAIAKEKFDRVAERFSIVGDVGTVMGRENVVAAPGSRDFATFGNRPFVRRYTNVFIWLDGRWRFLTRQAAILPQTSPAP